MLAVRRVRHDGGVNYGPAYQPGADGGQQRGGGSATWRDGSGVQAMDLPRAHPDHKLQLSHYTGMLGAPLSRDFYFYTIEAAPVHGMHYMGEGEIERWGLRAL